MSGICAGSAGSSNMCTCHKARRKRGRWGGNHQKSRVVRTLLLTLDGRGHVHFLSPWGLWVVRIKVAPPLCSFNTKYLCFPNFQSPPVPRNSFFSSFYSLLSDSPRMCGSGVVRSRFLTSSPWFHSTMPLRLLFALNSSLVRPSVTTTLIFDAPCVGQTEMQVDTVRSCSPAHLVSIVDCCT